MGLDFSHCNAHWSYGGFARFRRRLFEAMQKLLGRTEIIELDDMCGFGSPLFNSPPGAISWDLFKGEPLADLIYHSDCDGILTPLQCRTIAPRLREALRLLLPDCATIIPEDDYDYQHGMLLADGMDRAAEENEPLEFY